MLISLNVSTRLSAIKYGNLTLIIQKRIYFFQKLIGPQSSDGAWQQCKINVSWIILYIHICLYLPRAGSCVCFHEEANCKIYAHKWFIPLKKYDLTRDSSYDHECHVYHLLHDERSVWVIIWSFPTEQHPIFDFTIHVASVHSGTAKNVIGKYLLLIHN